MGKLDSLNKIVLYSGAFKEKNRNIVYFIYMDAETLCRYADCTKPLTNHDRIRLERLEKELEQKSQTGTLTEDYRATIRFMLEKGCKLEQEAVKVV